jgi:hypothetical protein
MAGITSLDPSVAAAEKSIEKMPPDKAVEFLLAKGVNPRLAGLVMKNRILKQNAQAAQPPQQTVAQQIDSQVNAAAAQRGQGISGLPVPEQMFEGKACGGVIGYDSGGGVAPVASAPSDYMSQMVMGMYGGNYPAYRPQQPWHDPNAPQPAPPDPSQGMAGGGIVAFAPGGPAFGADQGNQPVSASPASQMMQAQGLDDPNRPQQIPAPTWAAMQPQERMQAKMAFDQQKAQHDQELQALISGQKPPDQGAQPLQPGMGAPQPAKPAAPPPAAPPKPAPAPGPTGAAPPSSMQQSASTTGPNMGSQQRAEDMAKQQVADSVARAQALQPKSYEEHVAQIQDVADSQGIGAAAQMHLQDLAQRKDMITQMAQQGKWAAVAQAGFAMAEAATRNPHGGFLGALAVGGQKGGEMFAQTLKDKREATTQLQDQTYAVQQAQENLKLHYSDKAMDAYDKEMGRYENALSRVDAANSRLVGTVAGRELAQISARSFAAMRNGPTNELQQQMINNKPGSPAYEEAKSKLRDINAASSSVQSTEMRTQSAQQIAHEKLVSGNSPMAISYQQAVMKGDTAKASQLLKSFMVSGGGAGSTTGLSPEAIAALNKYTPGQ